MEYEKDQILIKLLDLPTPEIILKDEVDEEMWDYVFWALAVLRGKGSPPIVITIDSPGGDTDRGCDIYDALASYSGHITGTGISRAHSSASFILQACDTRCLTTHANIIIHNPSRTSVSLDLLSSKTRLKELLEDLRVYQEKLVSIYVARSGKTRNQIKTQLAKDEPMNATQALSFGLIDKIV
jgi:ATP-dependent Clp protease protease subunit